MSKLMAVILAVLGLAVLPVGMTGCEEEGPAERAGERLDNAGEEIEDAVDDMDDDVDIDIDD
jgi:hypothetical protein